MREIQPVCDPCNHPFHAMGPCTGYAGSGRCQCPGSWPTEDRDISGFCYVLYGTSPQNSKASHEACPGKDYTYPCQCDCHDDSFSPRALTPAPERRTLES